MRKKWDMFQKRNEEEVKRGKKNKIDDKKEEKIKRTKMKKTEERG